MFVESLLVVSTALAVALHWRLSRAIRDVGDLLQLNSLVADRGAAVHTKLFPVKAGLSHDERMLVVKDVCRKIGLNADAVSPDFNIATTGKLNDLLHHLAVDLKQDHPVTTIHDVLALFDHGRN